MWHERNRIVSVPFPRPRMPGPGRRDGKMEFNRQCVKIYYLQSQLRGKCKFNIYRLSGGRLFVSRDPPPLEIVGIPRRDYSPSHLRKRRDIIMLHIFRDRQYQCGRIRFSTKKVPKTSETAFVPPTCKKMHDDERFSRNYSFTLPIHLRAFHDNAHR